MSTSELARLLPSCPNTSALSRFG